MDRTDGDTYKTELIGRIIAVMNRTFTTSEGRESGLRALHERLLRLDESALRQLAETFGLDEPGEPEPDES